MFTGAAQAPTATATGTVNGDQIGVTVGGKQVGGFWYYLYPQVGGPQGSLATDTVTPDGYRVDASGRWVG